MKKLFAGLILLTAFYNGFCQKQYQYDSVVAHYDLLNNQPFAALQLEDTAGNILNTSTLSGKTIYVDFWFTACAPCIKEIPFSKALQEYFATDTNVVFLSICIENIYRKNVWRQMIKEKKMNGIHLFYARNRPQKINLLRQYKITFPTFLLVNKEMKVIGYDAPRPSEVRWVRWAIIQAENNILLSQAYKQVVKRSKEYVEFLDNN